MFYSAKLVFDLMKKNSRLEKRALKDVFIFCFFNIEYPISRPFHKINIDFLFLPFKMKTGEDIVIK